MAPLAFGKSVFAKGAAGGAGAAEFGFVTGTHGDTQNSNVGFLATRVNVSGDSFGTPTVISGSIWFRALLGDFGSERQFGYLIGGTPDNTGNRNVEVYLNRVGDGDGDVDDHSIVVGCQFTDGTRSISSFKTGADFFSGNSDFDNKVLDGNWHNLSFVFSATNTDRQLRLDGVDINVSRTDGPGDSVTGTIDMDGNSYSGANPPLQSPDNGQVFYHGTQQGPPGNFQAAFDIGPVWLYDSEIDFSNSSTMAQYYNSGNTDGYVTAGSQGTSAGAARAELFITTDGSSVSNGGSLTNATFHELGTVTKSDNSNGPGSGSTRTSANT